MGGRKAIGQAKRSRPGEDPIESARTHALLGVPFPEEFLNVLQHLNTPSTSSHPAKRRKTEIVPAVDSVTIWEHVVINNRPKSGDFPSLTLSGLQSAFKFVLERLSDSNSGAKGAVLVMTPRPSVEATFDRVAIDIDNDLTELSDQAIATINQRDSFWTNPNVEDACWISCDGQVSADEDTTTLTLTFKVQWNISTTTQAPNLSFSQRKFRRNVLALAFPTMFNISKTDSNSCSPPAFYKAAHVPDFDDTPSESAIIPGLVSKLYPFQRRAVQWLLRREGVAWSQDDGGNSVTEKIGSDPFNASCSFIRMDAVGGQPVYVSAVLGKITKDPAVFERVEQDFKGGILSEEMGLGKTVELVALLSLHRQPPAPDEDFDDYLGESVKTTSATLIVAPTSLKRQWLSELEKHAPGLRVMYYHGLSQSSRNHTSKANALIHKLRTHDVVVTTYQVLTSELDYALGEPDRARRAPRKYHRARSPLTQLRWWRVCMDEAQMIESGVSKSATLARLLPRVNAWGVTGTPVKDSVEDLRGLLLFLRYEPFCSNTEAWNNLISDEQDGFKRLFNRLALRHSKRLVRHEIDIPLQKRHVITMPFTAVEEQHYQTLFKEVVGRCGLSPTGEPLRDDWDPNDPKVLESMRAALDRLRQTALHPEVGIRNRRSFGHRNGPMRTIDEVLGVMIENSEVAMRTDQRSLFSAALTRGQLMENSLRVRDALKIWQGVLDANQTIIDSFRKELEREIEQAKASKPDGKPTDDEDGSVNASDENNTGRLGEARRRLRSALEIQHKATFFCANAYFQIKSNQEMTEPDSAEFRRLEKLETDGYEQAKMIRLEILEESRGKADTLMRKISKTASEQSFATIPEYQPLSPKGIDSRDIAESLVVLAGELNDQADQLDDWREHVIQLLLKPLVDGEGELELTGEEYEDSTKLMEEIVVYTQILRTALADREEALTGQVNKLVEHEAMTSLRAAQEGTGPFPEKLIELLQVRQQLKPKSKRSALRKNSVKASLFELRSAAGKLRSEAEKGSNRARIELNIVTEQVKATQQQLKEQSKITATMDQELDLFAATMNARVEFYRQLQNVSDQVGPYEGPTDDAKERSLVKEEASLTKKIDVARAKHRYLIHLRDVDSADVEYRMCVICRDDITIGVLTVCGHQFCKDCATTCFKDHHNCPVCRKPLTAANLHDMTLKPQELKVHSEAGPGPSPSKAAVKGSKAAESKSKSTAIYTEFSAEKLNEIRSIELSGPAFTSKVDNLARHLIWLRENSPGAKSIVFSQYADFLSVLSLAFSRHGIGYTSFDKPDGITDFKEDPSIEVFLLHARAHASGLNLTNAAHVFLCEPLVNTAIELQAIARVHRIGQEQQTTVWLYIVDGTVEESIYHLSVQRRMKHMHVERNKSEGKSKEKYKGKGKARSPSPTPELQDEAIEAANSLELEQANLPKLMGKNRAQGEAVDSNDLWECLFGHVRHQAEARNPGPALRGLLAAEAAEQRQS